MTAETVAVQKITLSIKDMTCMGCAATMQLVLSDLPGVHTVSVDLAAKQVHVAYDPDRVGLIALEKAVAEAGYTVDRPETAEAPSPAVQAGIPHPWWRKPLLFGVLGMAGLLLLYLGLVSLAEGWSHAVELLLEDAWIVGPILVGFGVQVGMYTYLKTVIHATARGTGALAGAGGGTSTAAMVACCAHHVTDVMPLLGLSAAATFLADYRIPFMVVGLATNLIGIGVMGYLIVRQRRRMAECALNAESPVAASACH